MRIVYLIGQLSPVRGGHRSLLAQAAYLARHHDVELVEVSRTAEHPSLPVTAVPIRVLLSTTADLHVDRSLGVGAAEAARLRELPTRLVPPSWEPGGSALTDLVLDRYLGRLTADVVVTSSLATLAAATGLLPPGVALVHHERLGGLRRKPRLATLDLLGRRVDAIVVGDPTTADYLRGRLAPAAPRVVAIPDPLPEMFRPVSLGTTSLIVAAGRMSPEQRFHRLLVSFTAVAAEMPDWRLRIFGDGPLRGQLAARCARSEVLCDRVELPGISDDMPMEWARASVAAVTCREGVPLVTAEAMAAGVPVVANDGPDGPRHLVEDGVDGLLVPQGSLTGYSAALLRLTRDPGLRTALGERARQSTARLAPPHVVPRWEALFADLVHRRGAGRRQTLPPASPDPAAQPAAQPSGRPAAEPEGRAPDQTPLDARRSTLRTLTALADAVTADWFVLRPVADAPPVLAVPRDARRAFLRAAAESTSDLVVLPPPETAGPREPSGALPATAGRLARGLAPVFSVGPAGLPGADPRSWGEHVDVQFWEVDDGTLFAPRPNEWARVIRRGATVPTEILGLTLPTLPLSATPTVADRTFPIDLVYTWVDGDDPEWQRRRDARLGVTTGLARSRQASGRARFTSRDELLYSLRSVHMFTPWARQVYLVTDDQVPDWLDTAHPRITVVSHREILRAENLPTFNSHAIETGLHHIDPLSEQFVYLNDDVLFARPVRPDQLFSPSGQFAVFMSDEPLGSDGEDAPPARRAGLNNRRLLERDFGVTITRTLRHSPHPHRRSVLDEIEHRYPEELGRTAASPFRGETDYSLASSLAQHYGLLTGSAYEGRLTAQFVALTEPDLAETLQGLLDGRAADTFCLADHHEWAIPRSRATAMVREFLDAYFPVAAPWERPRA